MADNIGYTPGTGATVAADEIGGVLYQRVKPTFGVDGTATDVSEIAPLPVAAYGELIESIEAMRMAIQSLNRTIGQTMPDTAGRARVVVDAITSTAVLNNINSVSAISSLTNQVSMGGFAATEQIPSLMRLGADALRRNVTVS